jgi:hypothetical protein
MDHQDWNPVIIHGKGTLGKRTTVNVPHREVTKDQKLDRTELGTHEKVSLSLPKRFNKLALVKVLKHKKTWRMPSEFQRMSSTHMNLERLFQTIKFFKSCGEFWVSS